MRDKVTRQCPQTTTQSWRERAEADSNRGPSAYQPNALPALGQNGSLDRVGCCSSYVHRNCTRDRNPGPPPRLSDSSWTLMLFLCCLMSSDVADNFTGTSWDQCRSMVQLYSFTFTETRRLVRTDSPGRPPRLSHSSWKAMSSDLTVIDFCCVKSTDARRPIRDGKSDDDELMLNVLRCQLTY